MFDTRHESLPPTLDRMKPGPILAAFLSAVDLDGLSGHDRVVVMRAHQRMASHYAAQVYESMAAVCDAVSDVRDDPGLAAEAAATEVRAALRMTRRAADFEVALALELRDRLPRALRLLIEGRIDARRARVLVRGVEHLPAHTARRVVDEVIDDAPAMTSGQLAARLRRLCVEAAPEEARSRYQRAVEERRVVIEAMPEGTANLHAYDLPPDAALSAARRIDRLARSLRGPGEERSMDQLRADVLCDLLQGTGDHGADRGSVEITVDLPTLAGLADRPGDVAGYGPVIAEIARKVADDQPEAAWSYTVADATGDDGGAVATGALRRRPTASQRRNVVSRNRRCVFPGCRMPATAADLDHTIPWADGGPTTEDNLAPLCRHDHRMRHEAGWRRVPLPGGDHLWTSPLGPTYTTSGRSP